MGEETNAGVPPPPPPAPFGKPRTTGVVPPAPAAAPAFVPIAGAPPLVPDGPSFPERMKANKVLAGRVCPGCNQAIDLGQDVFNCQTCHGTMHQACWDRTRACQQLGCPTRQAVAAAAQGSLAPAAAAATGDTKPCPYCGEQIIKAAKKCRFCGEFLNPADRLKQEKLASAATGDDQLSSTEWVFGILFGICLPLIPCIFALIWMAQGKKKGTTMLVISLVGFGINLALRGSQMR
ncbi:MAG: hypothetical protein HY291_16230 [Planctomycetes bacterium]|nr:hypothetical protein [Planctomycetota bacterium]